MTLKHGAAAQFRAARLALTAAILFLLVLPLSARATPPPPAPPAPALGPGEQSVGPSEPAHGASEPPAPQPPAELPPPGSSAEEALSCQTDPVAPKAAEEDTACGGDAISYLRSIPKNVIGSLTKECASRFLSTARLASILAGCGLASALVAESTFLSCVALASASSANIKVAQCITDATISAMPISDESKERSKQKLEPLFVLAEGGEIWHEGAHFEHMLPAKQAALEGQLLTKMHDLLKGVATVASGVVSTVIPNDSEAASALEHAQVELTACHFDHAQEQIVTAQQAAKESLAEALHERLEDEHERKCLADELRRTYGDNWTNSLNSGPSFDRYNQLQDALKDLEANEPGRQQRVAQSGELCRKLKTFTRMRDDYIKLRRAAVAALNDSDCKTAEDVLSKIKEQAKQECGDKLDPIGWNEGLEAKISDCKAAGNCGPKAAGNLFDTIIVPSSGATTVYGNKPLEDGRCYTVEVSGQRLGTDAIWCFSETRGCGQFGTVWNEVKLNGMGMTEVAGHVIPFNDQHTYRVGLIGKNKPLQIDYTNEHDRDGRIRAQFGGNKEFDCCARADQSCCAFTVRILE